ncbi:MAG: NADH-quinone oxidoreductase subunit L [Deltaproteobacteria bacterium]|nr:NADH-quinone oxidoreductase subunit L [Deltaproteobacteria bacterium]
MQLYAWLAIILPLIGIPLIWAGARINGFLRNTAAVAFPIMAALCALRLFPLLLHPEQLPLESSRIWITHPFTLEIGILLDPLSLILTLVVSIISAVIAVYCLGYMKGDPGICRFLMLVNLFIGSMLLLVLANNLLLLFVGWKLVGLCSYGLIGFYYQDDRKYWIGGPPGEAPLTTPSFCGLKALVVTGVGDLIMLGGILILYGYAGTLNLMALYHTAPVWFPEMARNPNMVILVSFMLLAGPIGKSAQFPLHEWLPEAMAGPGPVSALIHAATMVKSGVYLVARLMPIFYIGRWVADCPDATIFFTITAWVGAITAFLAATQGLVAKELKKILAFSTVSQIGYMWIGLGVAGLTQTTLVAGTSAGIFHLISHAIFKACLFLCAGSVIHAAHSIYIQDMGGMRRYMPRTWLCMLIAAVCLMGVPPLPGFWSKDAILLAGLEAHHIPIFIIAIVTVALTAFYTTRMVGIVFYGPESRHLQDLQKKSPSHEAPAIMWGACALLALMILALGLGGPWAEHLLHHNFTLNLTETLNLPVNSAEPHPFNYHLLVTCLSIGGILAGAIPAWLLYGSRKISILIQPKSVINELYVLFWRRWYIDSFYNRVFIDGTLKFADFIALRIENNFDTLLHRRLPALVTENLPNLFLRLKTESENFLYIGAYLMAIIMATIGFALWH